MSFITTIDLGQVARGLNLPPTQIESVVRLLDAGNTVPFITRYRKDQTGGLDEQAIREIELRVGRLRMLAERKQTILRSIDGQGKLTPELAKQIESADSIKRLEDLYLPFKPKKQSLATLARERALQPLAGELLSASPAALDLDARARDFVNPDKQIHTAADALLGVGHIIAEDFSERADLRGRLRKIYKRSGRLVSTKIERASDKSDKADAAAPRADELAAARTVAAAIATDAPAPMPVIAEHPAVVQPAIEQAEVVATAANSHVETTAPQAMHTDVVPAAPAAIEHAPADAAAHDDAHRHTSQTELFDTDSPEEAPAAHVAAESPAAEVASADAAQAGSAAPALAARVGRSAEKKARDKEKEKEQEGKEFRDYFDYKEQLGRVPPHRVLAINRGEKAKFLRVKVEVDTEELYRAADDLLVPPEHPHADFLRGCARDAMTRLVIPSLEREIRRELTEHAEMHAVDVFARNLRNLLLQAPIRGRRLLALDPGFKSGCKLAVLDEFGSLLDQAVVHIVGKPERRLAAKAKIVELIKQHDLTVIAIGNGTACRESEDLVTELLAEELKDGGVAYVIVNEAGASVYSTSPLGREEFPTYDATLRGAISIGRRLQDPLSELVKIDAASIGVGLYQHDVKAKHLRASLDAVVESCVNYVGVDLNSASPALLRYVSGLNQLTARRLYDYRVSNGPFKNREQLREVPGFGEATFVQAAGFLKIIDGDNPLDATWIHPESYDVARRALERMESSVADLASKETIAKLAAQAAQLQVNQLADELHVGAFSLADIVAQFGRPGRDPREDLPQPMFKKGVLKLEDLSAGMELSGSVLNVVDFGAFVDIGLHDSGLVHVSQLANKFVRDPHEVVSVGDIVKVWVLEIDKGRRRVSLTMIAPGTPRPPQPGRAPRPEGAARPDRPPRPPRPAGAPPAGQRAGGGRPGGGRPNAGQPAGNAPAGSGPPSRRPPRGKPPAKPPYNRPVQQPPRPKPKPVVPLTKAMKEGKEPLRTFGDLAQFFEQKKEPEQTGDQPAPPKS